MLFNSLSFALFFPVTVLAFFALPHRLRWAWLLLASYFFYMSWKPAYALLLLASTALSYIAGLGMTRSIIPARRRAWLALALGGNVGMLFFFKYFSFANDSLRALFGAWGWNYPVPVMDVLLPVGISFFVFQSLGYALDVYFGRIQPERHAGHFALFVSFFPQLVAGPIERAKNLLPQLTRHVRFDPALAASGLGLMLWGMFKKVVIADRLGLLVDPVYDHPAAYSGMELLLATYFFAFQIFCDFSGYTDIAIGAARVMGIDLMKNFARPYFAASVADFWRRWHISLSTWFKDYLYFPLGGNRVGPARWRINILIVFAVSGLWHGANWTFLIWGLLHGVYLLSGAALAPLRARLSAWIGLDRAPALARVLGVPTTFHLVLFAWIFFRARSLADAWHIIKAIGFGSASWAALTGVSAAHLAWAAALVLVLEGVHALQARGKAAAWVGAPAALRWTGYLALLLAVLNLRPAQVSPFIYFQF